MALRATWFALFDPLFVLRMESLQVWRGRKGRQQGKGMQVGLGIVV
jgi:hypothetical protein